MKRAIVYHAVCQKRYFKLARRSARSAKNQMPNVDTVLITDLPGESQWFDEIVRIDPVELVAAHLPPLLHLPSYYGSGIYLDADSRVCGPLYDVFELVEGERVDIALVHSSGRARNRTYPQCGVPTAYPHWRSAFIAFQNRARARAFFVAWGKTFHEHRERYGAQMAHEGPCFTDQLPMRVALYYSDVTIATLPAKYCLVPNGVVVRGTVRTIATNGNGEGLATEANQDAPHARLFVRGKSRRLD